MKNINPLGLFDDHFLMEKLTKLGDLLERLNGFIDWNIFEKPLKEAFMDESIVRTIGIARAETKIGFMNLAYNICRTKQLKIMVRTG